MLKNREVPEVNAGSMADIAFLLLIFFLVTTTLETNAGIKRMLPRKEAPTGRVSEKNILRVSINASDELMVENELTSLKELRRLTIEFLDNGGAQFGSQDFCGYCKGVRHSSSSDNPNKAIVSVSSNRNTSYEMFISVQNELVCAYNHLRNREAERLFSTSFIALKEAYENSKNNPVQRFELKHKIEKIQELFPMKISEAELKE